MTGSRADSAAGDLLTRAVGGDVRSLSRLLSLVEEGGADDLAVGGAGRAHVVGVTGAPGVGKSTTVSALVGEYRGAGCRVAVLAVDPSSPHTGGALLGDRIRMQAHAAADGVYIRSMSARGQLGGLASATSSAARVLEAVGFDIVVVETVGVGQNELEVASVADTTLVLLAPGMGDAVQAAKAGILEIGDVYVVNKADRDGAHDVVRALRSSLTQPTRTSGKWRSPVLLASAETGAGLPEVVEQLGAHREWLTSSGEGEKRRARRARAEVEALALATLRRRWADEGSGSAPLGAEVAAGRLDVASAAARLLDPSPVKS